MQETKAPAGYFANDTVFVQKRDLETKKAEPQGSASLESAVFTVTSLNDHPVIVEGETYTENQVVLTLITDSKGTASAKKDAVPFGHCRIDETNHCVG